MNGSGSRVVYDTNLRSVGEQNRCQVGPTILFECPAQIPRSFLRSFSLWARHLRRRVQSGTCAWVRRNFSRGQQAGATGEEAAEGRKCEGGEGRASVHDTTYDPLVEEPLSGGAHNSLRVPRPDPPLLPSIIFPLGPPFCGDE